MPKHLVTLCILVLVFTVLAGSAAAQELLMMPPSPEANGRAGVYFSGDSHDPLAPISNPGLLGLMANHDRLLVSAYPARAKWSVFDMKPFGYSSRSVQLGFDQRAMQRFLRTSLPLSFGFGYQETNLDLGDLRFVDENGHETGTGGKSYENTRGFDMAVGLNYRRFQAGLGFTHKLTTMHWGSPDDYSNFASDVGAIVQARLERFFYHTDPVFENGQFRAQPFGTVSLGYTVANLGPKLRLKDSFRADPLERTATMSLGGEIGLKAAHPVEADWRLVSFGAGVQTRDLLIAHDGEHYKSLLGDIHPLRNLVLGKGNDQLGMYTGFEVGILETFYYRVGRAHDDNFYWRGTDTEGYGFSLGGLLKLAELSPRVRAGGIASVLARHLDLRLDYSSRKDHPDFSGRSIGNYPYDSILNSMIYRSVSLAWRQ